jgi:hypothetical protein
MILAQSTKIFCFLLVHPSRSFAKLLHLSWNSVAVLSAFLTQPVGALKIGDING